MNEFFTIERGNRSLVQFNTPPMSDYQFFFQHVTRSGVAWRFGSLASAIRMANAIIEYKPTQADGLSIADNKGNLVWSYPNDFPETDEAGQLKVDEDDEKVEDVWVVVIVNERESTVRVVGVDSEQEGIDWTKEFVRTCEPYTTDDVKITVCRMESS